MTYKMFCIFDFVLGAFEPPFCAISEASARRTFDNLLNDPDSPYSRNKDDFSLWCVGSFNTEHGVTSEMPVQIMTGFGGDK